MEKIDLSKVYKTYFKAKPTPQLVDIEPAQYLSVSGKGDPSGAEFAGDVQALYSVAYAVKFACKDAGWDFKVSSLEALWSYDEKKYANVSMEDSPTKIPRSEWNYTLLIMMPEFVTEKIVAMAKDKKKDIAKSSEVAIKKMNEGTVVQMLHVGPFDQEPVTLKKILEFSAKENLGRNGLHHEIYLSDFRKTPPNKLKTILREPVKPL